MKSDTRSFYEAIVQRAVEHIFEHLDDALDLGALARTAALSPLHFHRVFKGMLGETPLELHRRLRMERAAYALSTTDAPVTRVAFEAGYETHESFTRAFGDHYGAAPSEVRRRSLEARMAYAAVAVRIELASRSGIHFDPRVGREISLSFALNDTTGVRAMKVELKSLPDLRVAAVRHIGPYNEISAAFERLGQIASGGGIFGPSAEMLAIYHDDPESTPVAELRSDAALTVPKDRELPTGLTEIHIPAARYAVATHVGPYIGLGEAWARLMGRWVPENGHRIAEGPSFEIYRNTPMDTPPEKLLTEIYVPVV